MAEPAPSVGPSPQSPETMSTGEPSAEQSGFSPKELAFFDSGEAVTKNLLEGLTPATQDELRAAIRRELGRAARSEEMLRPEV